MDNENSVDGPADALRDGLLASGTTIWGMLADLRDYREADSAADQYKLEMVINNTAMSATFTSESSAMLTAVEFVQEESQTYFDGTLDERYAAARKWIIERDGTMEVIDEHQT